MALVSSGESLGFNTASSSVMHVDINSCFATIEQQANPLLRGKPVAVAAYDSPGGCILAASIEAKQLFGIKTGMRVKEGKSLFPDLIVLPPDPNKYRHVHLKLRQILSCYSNDLYPKSIDEFVLHLRGYPILREKTTNQLGLEIKKRIRKEIGEWIKVSIGIGPSRFMAKTAAGLKKPDGLEEININNFKSIYSKMKLTDIHGIARRNQRRLNLVGIFSVNDFYNAPMWKLKAAFKSANANYWYMRLRGWEIDGQEFERRSYGNSFALPRPFTGIYELSPILSKLVNKMCFRLRRAGFKARGVHLSLTYRDFSYWHRGRASKRWMFDSRDFFKEALGLLELSPRKPVRILAISCFDLSLDKNIQTELYEDIHKKKLVTEAVDKINQKWGDFVICPANMLTAKDKYVHDRISFGGVKELV